MRLNSFPGFLWEPSLHQTFRAMNNEYYVFWQKQQSYASPLISARTEFLNPAWPGTPRTPLWIILPPSLSTSSSPMTRSEPPRCALVNVQSLAISMCWKHSPTTEKKQKKERKQKNTARCRARPGLDMLSFDRRMEPALIQNCTFVRSITSIQYPHTLPLPLPLPKHKRSTARSRHQKNQISPQI